MIHDLSFSCSECSKAVFNTGFFVTGPQKSGTGFCSIDCMMRFYKPKSGEKTEDSALKKMKDHVKQERPRGKQRLACSECGDTSLGERIAGFKKGLRQANKKRKKGTV